MADYVTYLARISRLRPFRGPRGQALIGMLGVLMNTLADGFRQAVRAPWIGDSVGPAYDALTPAGHELSMPRYPIESWSQYHERLKRAPQDWEFAGDEDVLLGQLAAAGITGVQIFDTRHWPDRPPTPWRTQFWLVFPAGTHPVTEGAPLYDDPVVEYDGEFFYDVGADAGEYIAIVTAIVRKWKPGTWVCRELIFNLDDGAAYDDGEATYDDGFTEYGDDSVHQVVIPVTPF